MAVLGVGSTGGGFLEKICENQCIKSFEITIPFLCSLYYNVKKNKNGGYQMEHAKYVNAFTFALNDQDFRLNLMVSEPVMDDNGTIIREEKEPVGKYVMTLSLAKDLAARLNDAINKIETDRAENKE